MQLWWRAPSKGEGRSLSSLLSHGCIPDVSPYSRMEKLGSEIATVFTHSHVVSLVVSSQPSSSPLFTLSSHHLGAGELFPNVQLFVRHSS